MIMIDVYIAIAYTYKSRLPWIFGRLRERYIRYKRYKIATRYAAYLMEQGMTCFSPITHGHPISRITRMDTDWKRWEPMCLPMIGACRLFHIVEIDGTQSSNGVYHEGMKAISLNKDVRYVDPETWGIK